MNKAQKLVNLFDSQANAISSGTLLVNSEPKETSDYRVDISHHHGEGRLFQKEGELAPLFAALKFASVEDSNPRLWFL